MPGTPLAEQPPVDIFELVRPIAVTRIAIPKARVRLAAGRTRLMRDGQAFCFFAGGNKLLTAANPAVDSELALLRELGLDVELRHSANPDTAQKCREADEAVTFRPLNPFTLNFAFSFALAKGIYLPSRLLANLIFTKISEILRLLSDDGLAKVAPADNTTRYGLSVLSIFP